MDNLDLHGIRHHEVEREVENFVLTCHFPSRIVTGNSITMKRIVENVLERYNLVGDPESDWNLGSLIIKES